MKWKNHKKEILPKFAALYEQKKMHGSIQPLLQSISGSPILMLNSPSRNYSSESVPTSSSVIAPEAAKLASAIVADASRIKCVFGGPLSLCDGIL